MKYKHKLEKLASRIKYWEANLARKSGFRKPGSIK
jgi:hypothetical protein